MKVFYVKFEVFNSSCKETWRRNLGRTYEKHILAKDLNELLTEWPARCIFMFPWEDGSGGSHYSTDPIRGDRLEFKEIKIVEEDVLCSAEVDRAFASTAKDTVSAMVLNVELSKIGAFNE